jgi:hypothetical protein
MDTPGNSQEPIPKRVTLLRINPAEPAADQLFIDQVPVPREAWRYDPVDRTLSWQGLHGGGHLYLHHDGRGAVGTIGPEHSPCSVTAGARAQFLCSVALNSGATYETSGGAVVGFAWDPSSAAWKSAKWVKDRLLLTYTVTQGGPMEPPTFTFEFADQETGAIPWDPTMGAFSASLQLGQQAGRMVWNLTFRSSIPPAPDDGPSTGPDSVYPYWMQAVEDAAAMQMNGVLQIDGNAPGGTLVGLQGVRNVSLATGYYRTSVKAAPFGVFDGRMVIGGKPVAGSAMRGNVLSWDRLDPEHQRRTGLPASGSLRFTQDGASADDRQNLITARRLRSGAAIQAIAEHGDLHPAVHTHAVGLQLALAQGAPDIYGLLAMTPFAQQDGAWGDVVQAAVRQDLSDIMNSYISPDMWKLLFPDTPQPTLSGELAVVANSPVPGVSSPTDWYRSLATAVMTQGLAGGSDANCANLNGSRAGEWLKTQVATSPVYHAHGQLLFQYEWNQRFPSTSQYLNDQIANAATYATSIDQQVQKSIDDINTNVVTDASSPPDLKQKMIADVQEAGQYAKTNKLYWAFAYYTYNTAPAILANIAIQMGISTGSSDGTTLSRLFQQNMTVLTALDPSGYFARRYTSTLNVFLATNVLPNMFGFTGDAVSFDIIKLYLQQFVNDNLHSEDQQIAATAAQIKQILDDDQADEMLHASIEALRSFSETIQDALALPYVANRWVSWFRTSYPKFSAVANVFGGLLIGGVTGLAVFNLFRAFKDWSKLSDAERAEIIIDASQLGLQIVAAMVQRGVRIYAIFNVQGMSTWQRTAAIGRIAVTGEAEQLDLGLMQIGNSTARWLGDVEGTVGKVAVMDQGVVTAVLVNNAAAGAEEATWAAKIFGKNLDEFIATRIGPLFILAGIGLSIYFISTGESGIALASDILNIVGGALMLFATIGGWAIEGGLIAAEGVMASIISFAGPLAILAALAGLGLMLYEMFHKPPDPVEEFVNTYARPAGFYVSARASSIDYAAPYASPDRGNLMMIGFSLSVSGQALCCGPSGVITLGAATALPSCVWQVTTDGVGMSKIFTVAQPDATKPPVVLYLSRMSDQSVCFQPAMAATPSPAQPGAPTVTTQTWLSTPQGNATLTGDGKSLVSLPLMLQPVLPDPQGNYAPSQASGWLVQSGSGLGINAGHGQAFTLAMSGMAPNFMTMVNLPFLLNSTPSTQQSFGPRFGVLPSTPLSFAVSGPALPAFLTFDPKVGTFAPNGQQASAAIDNQNVISATNPLGTAQATFTVKVAAAPSSTVVPRSRPPAPRSAAEAGRRGRVQANGADTDAHPHDL